MCLNEEMSFSEDVVTALSVVQVCRFTEHEPGARGGNGARRNGDTHDLSESLTRSGSAVAGWRLEDARHSAASRGGTETELANSTLNVNLGR